MLKAPIVHAAKYLGCADANNRVPKRTRDELRTALRAIGQKQAWPIVQNRSVDAALPIYAEAFDEVAEYVARRDAKVAA